MAYGPVLEGRSCVIADQSGSGKTLAYLCPIVQNLRKEEAIGIHKPSPRNPRVIILTPTAELSSQVYYTTRWMWCCWGFMRFQDQFEENNNYGITCWVISLNAGPSELPFNIEIWGSLQVNGCDRWISTEDQLESLDQELDVLIATPGRFLYLL